MNMASARTHIPIHKTKRVKSKGRVLRRVSVKRSKLNKEYAKLRDEFLKAHPYCEYHWKEWGLDCPAIGEQERKMDSYLLTKIPASTEIHHVKGRGKYLLDTSTWMAVSREGHLAIHANPAISYAKGYMQIRK